jgi:hypothetical protein
VLKLWAIGTGFALSAGASGSQDTQEKKKHLKTHKNRK